jgi:hypothetical protein
MKTAMSKPPSRPSGAKGGNVAVETGGSESLKDILSKFESALARPQDDECGRIDAKCFELEMTNTELLAAPSASIRKRAVKVAIDSGAGDHVASPEDVEGFSITESANSRANRNFVAANGGKIKNHGQATVRGKVKGRRIASTFQVADVTRPLYSVSKLCDAGYKVDFTKEEATVLRDGKIIHRFPREGGLYVAEMSIGEDDQAPPFGGQGAMK